MIKDTSRLWLLCFAVMIMAINCVNATAESTELESLRKRLDMADLRLASDILVLRRELDSERRLRMELQSTVLQLQEQLQQPKIAINHTRSLEKMDLQQQKFSISLTKCIEETDILKVDLKAQQTIIEQLQKDVQNVNYENQIWRNGNTRLHNENEDLRHNIVVLRQAFSEEKQQRKHMESLVQDLRLKHEDLQLNVRAAIDQMNELMQYKSSSETNFTSIRSELHHVKIKHNDLNSFASTARITMDTYIDGVSNQVCQLNPSYVNVCQNYGINKSSCCLRRALDSLQETLKANGLKLSEFEKQMNLRISFSARISLSINDLNPWDTIVFSDVVHNEGSAYNPTNGKFVAPVSGTYVFFSHILGYSRGLETALKINEDVKLWLYSGDPKYHAPGSNMLVIQLYKGDSARMVKNGPWGDRPFYIHYLWSTFSGFLLSAD